MQSSGNDDLTVRAQNLSNDEETKIRAAVAGLGGQTTKIRDELIGPSLGDELRQKALIALGVALAAQLLYLAVRFRWTFGAAAVIAMAHDVIILVGIFAWLGKPIDGCSWQRCLPSSGTRSTTPWWSSTGCGKCGPLPRGGCRSRR